MSAKAIVFIDGGWLYKCRTALFSRLGEENFEIDYAKLPRIICEDVAHVLDEDVSLVRTLYFGTIPSARSGFNTGKQNAFYSFLESNCNYDTYIHEVDVGGDDVRRPAHDQRGQSIFFSASAPVMPGTTPNARAADETCFTSARSMSS